MKLCDSYRSINIIGQRIQNAKEDILTQEVRKLHDEEHL
jgi:hypothetical protein